MYNVICVKFGTKYDSEYVNKLYKDLKVKAKSAFTFYCYTDDPKGIDQQIEIIPQLKNPTLKGVWNKLRLFDEEICLEGRTFYFDLDVKILKDPFIEVDWNRLTVVYSHFKDPGIIRQTNYDVTMNSSVMAWNYSNPDIQKIWDHFNTGYRDYYLRKYVGIDRFITHEGFDYDLFPHEYIQSAKYQPEVDYEASVLTFEEIDVGLEDLK